MAYSVGQKVQIGTLRVKGTTYAAPSNPTYNGNLINYHEKNNTTISNDSASNIEIVDTESGKALTFIYVEDNGKKLLICDRNLVNYVTWDGLQKAGLIFGKEVRIDGKKFKLRSLTGGTSDSDENNEWSRIIEKNQYGIGNGNSNWNWNNCYTWCQETSSSGSDYRTLRGYLSASNWTYNNRGNSDYSFAFRPVLEILNTAPLISDTDKALGDFQTPLVKSYSVSDSESQRMTIVEKIDSTIIRTLRNQTGGNFEINLSSRWDTLSMGSHRIEIKVTDSEGESSTRVFTFNKRNSAPPKPVVEYPLQNQRTSRNFDVIFTPQRDVENDSQTFIVEVATDSNFNNEKQTFSTLMKQTSDGWENVPNFSNSDHGKKFKISVSLQNDKSRYVRVVATDSSGTSGKVYSNTVKISPINVLKVQTKPYQTKYIPKAVSIKMDAIFDNKVQLKVEVCNNGNDTTPTWEDATEKYNNEEQFVFSNTVKTASSYAVSARITLEANDSTSEISIKTIGMGVK